MISHSQDDIIEDDLFEFEDKEIYNRQDLDIKEISIYVHKLINWDGITDEKD